MPDPLEACKVLTERANLAGGHDNITVIVARFDGPGLKPLAAGETLKYTKYALPGDPREEAHARPPTASVDEGRRSAR